MSRVGTAATRFGALKGSPSFLLPSSSSASLSPSFCKKYHRTALQKLSHRHLQQQQQERDVETRFGRFYEVALVKKGGGCKHLLASCRNYISEGDLAQVPEPSSSRTFCSAVHTAVTKANFQSLVFQRRKLWTSMPVQMGRRSCKIAARKGAQNAKKGKLYGKFGKEIVSAIKRGGTNPIGNTALAALLQFAKDFDIPKEIVERNIKKASDKNQQDYEEITYEAYGFGGVGIVVEVLTDNLNRAAATVRDVVKKCGAKMADQGSVLFNFRRAGVVNVRADKVNADALLAAAMDSGAEDVIEPTLDEDEDPTSATDKFFKVITPSDQYAAVTKKLQAGGVPVDVECSGLELIPTSTFEVDDEAIELNKALLEKLLELDDVDAVYSNQA